MNEEDLARLNGPAVVEPTAEQRAGAHMIRQLFVAYTLEGFTEAQALQLLGHMFRAGGGQ